MHIFPRIFFGVARVTPALFRDVWFHVGPQNAGITSFYLDAVSGIDVPVNSAASDVRPRARPRAVSLQSPQ